ncbi:hypothetical protein QOT17_016628 [Balamuthia mandrillaris]
MTTTTGGGGPSFSLQRDEVDALCSRLNHKHSHQLANLVESFADQRNGTTLQRLHEARVVDISHAHLHLWEEEEPVDVFFEHKALEVVPVDVPLPFGISDEADLWRAFEELTEQSQQRWKNNF